MDCDQAGVRQQFLACLATSDHQTSPFDYWLLQDVFPVALLDAIEALPFAPPDGARFDGRRESNNAARVYFTPEIQRRFPASRQVVSLFDDPLILDAVQRTTGADLSRGQLRIEYCQDVDGFWLEPHLDISVKLFTMLVYLSKDPRLADSGTDIYDATPEHNWVTTAPYAPNKGLIFIPGTASWHGFRPRRIIGVRKSIIINFVSEDWQARAELAHPRAKT